MEILTIISVFFAGCGITTYLMYKLEVRPLVVLIAQMRKEGYIVDHPMPERKTDPEVWLDIPEG